MPELFIYYDNEPENPMHRDEEARELAETEAVGSGTDLATIVRDIQFRYGTDEDLEAAKGRFRDARFRFFP